jgi:ProP effector
MRWPQTFPQDFREVKPWAIGIAKDVARLLPEQPPLSVKDAISIYRLLATPSYCRALLQGGPRYDLDGNPRGEVTAEDQEKARQDLKAFYERRKARQKRPTTEKAEESRET